LLTLNASAAGTVCSFLWPKNLDFSVRDVLWSKGMYIGLNDAFCRYTNRSIDVKVTRLSSFEKHNLSSREYLILGDRLRLICEDCMSELLLSVPESLRIR
jgi:hypothetical protein